MNRRDLNNALSTLDEYSVYLPVRDALKVVRGYLAQQEQKRRRLAARQAQAAAVDADEFQKAADDMIRTGTGFMRDGKRIDPADVFIATRPDTSADEGESPAEGDAS